MSVGSPCVNHGLVFYFLYLTMFFFSFFFFKYDPCFLFLNLGGLTDLRDPARQPPAPPRASLTLKDSAEPGDAPLYSTIQTFYLTQTKALFPAPNHPRARYHIRRTTPRAHRHHSNSPVLPCLPGSLGLSFRNPGEGCPAAPSALCAPPSLLSAS